MKNIQAALLALCVLAGMAWGGKQKIIVRLREPLRAENVKIRVPELSTGKGETRDLETTVQLGEAEKIVQPKAAQDNLKLNMLVRSVGKNAVQVTLTLPEAATVQLILLDFYGKNQGTLLDGPLPRGIYNLTPFTIKETDHNGINFMTLKLNGKVAVKKKVLTKVR